MLHWSTVHPGWALAKTSRFFNFLADIRFCCGPVASQAGFQQSGTFHTARGMFATVLHQSALSSYYKILLLARDITLRHLSSPLVTSRRQPWMTRTRRILAALRHCEPGDNFLTVRTQTWVKLAISFDERPSLFIFTVNSLTSEPKLLGSTHGEGEMSKTATKICCSCREDHHASCS